MVVRPYGYGCPRARTVDHICRRVAGYASHTCSLDNVIRVRARVLPKQHADPYNQPQTFGGIESVCLAEIAEDATPQFIRQLWTHTRHWQCVLDGAGP